MSLESRRTEFNKYVWDHAADPFQASFDERRELSTDEIAFLITVYQAAIVNDEQQAVKEFSKIILNNISSFSLVLQIIGLTRSKILTDLKGSTTAATEGISVPNNYIKLPTSKAWNLAAPYLLKRIRIVFSSIKKTEKPNLSEIFQTLNQSTWPGYIRQERAKRSGHEAEYRLATLFSSLGISFEPEEKAENPLCSDAQIDGISFDLVVPNVKTPLLLFKSTVHTANIGQFGESKDHLEIDEARRWLETLPAPTRPFLMALIDGVGFRSNSAGLNGVLEKSDDFCQFRTIWKAVVVAGSRLNLPLKIYLPQTVLNEFETFINQHNYSANCLPKEQLKDISGLIEAGDALIKPNH